MKVAYSHDFEKQFASLDSRIKERFTAAIGVWTRDSFAKSLNNHALVGRYKGFRSINITGDYRAIYRLKDPDTGVFVAIGKHSQLYR